jgi:hypothetical protein
LENNDETMMMMMIVVDPHFFGVEKGNGRKIAISP